MKKWILILLAVAAVAVIAFVLATDVGQTPDKTPVIAIATMMSHPALDAAKDHAIKELKKEGFEDGKNARIILRNANGQMNTLSSIANELVAQDPDIIISITTPVSQAMKKVAQGPVVFSVVTDPVGAGLVASLDQGEEMITGASNAIPVEEPLKLIERITPNVKRLGVLFNPGEAASQIIVRQIRELAPQFGMIIVEGPVNSSGDVYPVAQSLATRVDALLLPTDNTVVSGMAGAVKVAVEHKIPLYAYDQGSVKKGALAAVSAGYAQVGTDTGKLAVRMLRGERNIPTVMALASELYINKKASEMMAVPIPEDVMKNATKVFLEISD